MNRIRWFSMGLVMALAAPAVADSRPLEVEVWTDRGTDAVYQPGDAMEVRVRPSDDGYLIVYEIDAEGAVRLLWPDQGSRGFVEGRNTLKVPSERSNLELVVDEPTGEGYLVALVSHAPFRDLPWYLRPYDLQVEGSGYAGDPDEEEGVTREGRIVGDPFVAMERIRRAVLADPEDAESFGTAYTTYYVHEHVRYPRYLCYDCHRPGYWAWWDGFDPYYSRCSTFDFRVNWGWTWGPGYWFGYVPYYYYVPRYDCPPRYRLYTAHSTHFSSWDGWRRWRSLMGSSVKRYKTRPPTDYVPPSKYKDPIRGPKELPPGFMAAREVAPGRNGGGLRPSADLRRPASGRGVAPGVMRSGDEGVRIVRPRDVSRGGRVGRAADPDVSRGSDRTREPRREDRGSSWHSGGQRTVAPGRYETPGRARHLAPRREIERPREVSRPREVERQRGRGSSRVEAPKVERRDERQQNRHEAPKARDDRRQESRSGRGGGRGR